MQPTCQSARGILRLVVETRGKRSRLGGSRVFGLGAVAAFLHVSMSSSADVSLCPSLSHFPPIHLHFLFLKPQWGCQTGSLMFPWCPVLKLCTLVCLARPSSSVCPYYSFLFPTQVLIAIISSALFCFWVMYCLFSLCISGCSFVWIKASFPFYFISFLDIVLVIFRISLTWDKMKIERPFWLPFLSV